MRKACTGIIAPTHAFQVRAIALHSSHALQSSHRGVRGETMQRIILFLKVTAYDNCKDRIVRIASALPDNRVTNRSYRRHVPHDPESKQPAAPVAGCLLYRGEFHVACRRLAPTTIFALRVASSGNVTIAACDARCEEGFPSCAEQRRGARSRVARPRQFRGCEYAHRAGIVYQRAAGGTSASGSW